MTGNRTLVISTVVLAVVQCLLWLLAASITWTFRDLRPFVSSDSSTSPGV